MSDVPYLGSPLESYEAAKAEREALQDRRPPIIQPGSGSTKHPIAWSAV